MNGAERRTVRPSTELGSGGEFDLIRSVLGREGPTGSRILVGPGDDALVLVQGTVISTDMSLEDVHFRRAWLDDREIGYRAAAVAMSDLAAVAAEPVGALISVAVEPSEAETLVPALMAGVREALEASDGELLGGDVSSSPGPVVLDAVAVGRTTEPHLRSHGKPGDALWVTGRLGGAAEAVRAWERGEEPTAASREAFAEPKPRIPEALWLTRKGEVQALIDLSDGLAGDAGHLAAASGVRVVLEADRIPFHRPDSGAEALQGVLSGGEDYELLMSAPAGSLEPLSQEFELRFGLTLTRVGRMEEGEGVYLEADDGLRPLAEEEGGFSHFEASPDDEPPSPEDGGTR